jgi:hypothetical protein
MTTHNVKDELVEQQVKRHLRVVQTSTVAGAGRPKPERLPQFARHRDRMLEQEDDAELREGSARFRQHQLDYERHTSEPVNERRRAPNGERPLGVLEGLKAILTGAVILGCALWLAYASCAHGLTPTNWP